MSKFEDRLWSDLVCEHGAELELAGRVPPLRARSSRRAPIAVGGLGLAGVIAGAALTLSAATSPQAFAVTQNADGSVTLTINELVGVSAANEELAKLGVRAVVAKFEPSCTATGTQIVPPTGTPDLAQQRQIVQPVSGAPSSEWVIHPDAIPPGDTLSLLATEGSGESYGIRFTEEGFGAALYSGPAPACYPPGEERQAG